MKILLGNFAGAHSNLGKFLTWCLIKKPEDKIFFLYWNKGALNDNPEVWPIQECPKEANKNFFYKYFEFPKETPYTDYLTPDLCILNYPCFLNEPHKSLFPLSLYPKELHPHNGFVFTSKALADPNFQEIRTIFHSVWNSCLKPTPYFLELMQKDITTVLEYIQKGRVLCVMLRYPGHFTGEFDVDSTFLQIKETMKSFDFILPITQQEPFYIKILEEYGNQCIQLDRKRLPYNRDWTSISYTDAQFEEEFHVAVKDSYLASMCHTIMGGSSGLFFSALFINPTANMIIFDSMKTKDAY